MSEKKTLRQREKELQALLATAEGRAELEGLAFRYGTASGRAKPKPHPSIWKMKSCDS